MDVFIFYMKLLLVVESINICVCVCWGAWGECYLVQGRTLSLVWHIEFVIGALPNEQNMVSFI